MARAKKSTETTDLGVMDMSMAMGSVETVEDAPVGLGFWHADGKETPDYATAGSAGMDIRANLVEGRSVKFFDSTNQKREKTVKEGGRLFLEPGERFLIPTGLHADIPSFTYLAIHARSGTSWKEGLILTNGVAVIDSDYVEEIFVSITNISGVRVVIEDGDRIAQMLLMPVTSCNVVKLTEKPSQKTDRNGGFGSTGSK